MAFLNLDLAVKVIGWVLTIGPIAAVLTISVHLILGAAKDDDTIKGIVSLGFSLFFLGIAMLLIAYFTDVIHRIGIA